MNKFSRFAIYDYDDTFTNSTFRLHAVNQRLLLSEGLFLFFMSEIFFKRDPRAKSVSVPTNLQRMRKRYVAIRLKTKIWSIAHVIIPTDDWDAQT